jgi:alkylated DNA nucleotide flippase Atl1
MVGRAASTMDDFPNAHRVLRADGTVGRGTDPGARNSAERARRILEDEGVSFSRSGRADPSTRVYWDELQRRMSRRPGVSRRR